MADIDLALRLLQNKVRRQILERLVREPHYPMQLADLIGVSQQAIKKHLRELENGNFVAKLKVPSEKGGPPRTIYTCLLYTSPSPRDQRGSRMPSSA